MKTVLQTHMRKLQNSQRIFALAGSEYARDIRKSLPKHVGKITVPDPGAKLFPT